MPCPNCAFVNPPGTAYCGRCGVPLSQTPGPTVIFVCVSGPEAGRQLLVGGQAVGLGTAAEGTASEVAFQHGQFYFRSRSDRPLVVNGQAVMEGVLPPGVPILVGQSWWQITSPPPSSSSPPAPNPQANRDWFQNLNHRVGAVTGGGPVENLNASELFSEVFHRHEDADVEEYFMAGTRTTTPPLVSVRAVWPKPWVFFRIFALSLLVFFGFSVGVNQFENANCLPGLIITGSFAIPLTVVIFYFEMNVPHNVSFYQVFKAILVGGILALMVTLFWSGVLESAVHLPLPGIIEEIGKASVLLLFVRSPRYHWTLNGLLLGGAIGAGFAGFESAGYALTSLLGSLQVTDTGGLHIDLGAVQHSILLRGVLAPGGHVAWAALEGAALWKVKGDRPFDWSMVTDIRFLRVLGLAMVLHTVWDLPILGLPLPTLVYLPLLGVLSVIAWLAILSFLQDGLAQIQLAQSQLKPPQATAEAG